MSEFGFGFYFFKSMLSLSQLGWGFQGAGGSTGISHPKPPDNNKAKGVCIAKNLYRDSMSPKPKVESEGLCNGKPS